MWGSSDLPAFHGRSRISLHPGRGEEYLPSPQSVGITVRNPPPLARNRVHNTNLHQGPGRNQTALKRGCITFIVVRNQVVNERIVESELAEEAAHNHLFPFGPLYSPTQPILRALVKSPETL